MDRREAISRIGILLGGTVIGSGMFIKSGCTSTAEQVNKLFTQSQINLLNEIADTIIPETDTPGAGVANVGEFMAIVVTDCYSLQEQKVFVDGIEELDKVCHHEFGKKFIECDQKQRTRLLTMLDAEQKVHMENKKNDNPAHYFRMMKELTLLGFFTSETGATQTLRYIKIPGKYDGCVVYGNGDRAWLYST